MGKPRKRNVAKNNQQPKNEDGSTQKREERSGKTQSSSTGLIVILVIMVGLTWGIAATAYFGVVDYKALITRYYHDISSEKFVLQAPYEIIDKRRIVAGIGPSRKTITNLAKRETPSAELIPPPDGAPEQDNVESIKKVPGDEERKSERKQEPEKTKQPEEENERKSEKVVNEQAAEKSKEKPKKKKSISSKADKPILEKLKEGEKMLTQKKGDQALKFFKQLAKDYPESPRARYGLARSEELVAEQQRSNPMVLQAIKTYDEVVALPDCPHELKKKALMARSDKQMFLGKMKPALESQLRLAKMFPGDIEVLNKLGVRYLMIGQNKAAKKVYGTVLKIKPDDGFALVHMGFIMKSEGDWKGSIPYLRNGTSSDELGTQEGKFYFHLGDALHRTNRTQESKDVYQEAAQKGLFRSAYQRSLYNVDRLKGQPYWTPEEAQVKDYVRRLEMNWKVIRDEGLAVMDKETGLFQLEEESLKDTGEWRQFTLYARGVKNEANCRKTPKTCSIMDRMPNAKGCRRGQIKYSVMMPGTHVWAHTGPTNCRLRMHLGLVVPTTGSGARLACAGIMRTWEEGKILIFDDSFEHEVWQEAESFRLILIIDIWHPELTEQEKKTLTPI